MYNLFLFDNSDLSNFLKSFACDLSPQNYQTKYSTLSDTGKMNHANKPETSSYFHYNVQSLGNNKHKLDDFFQMTEVNLTFIAISEIKLKPNFIVNINIPGFNFVHNPSQTNSSGVGFYINAKLTYQLRNDPNIQNVGREASLLKLQPYLANLLLLVLSIAIQRMYFHPSRMNLLNLSSISKRKIVNI